jgi:hypothetical protein
VLHMLSESAQLPSYPGELRSILSASRKDVFWWNGIDAVSSAKWELNLG